MQSTEQLANSKFSEVIHPVGIVSGRTGTPE
jgi:hypothetical protein